MDDSWKGRFPSAAAAEAMRSRISKWLDALGTGDPEQLKRLGYSMGAEIWRENFDFQGVPQDVMEGAARHISAARAAIDAANPDDARRELRSALKIWS